MRNLLKEFSNDRVDVFASYIYSLRQDQNNDWWIKNIKDVQFAYLFKREANKGMYIDGESITIQWRKKLVVSYDYHAYKNKVISSYPESVFDFDLVYEGDSFTFSKEDGKVNYSHLQNNPFDDNKKIIGAYGIIKNKRGEFLEKLTLSDIDKMRKTAKTTKIWDAWYDRMVKKSIIKRICSVAFHDITDVLDKSDNEDYNPSYVELSDEIADAIKNAETIQVLTDIYNKYISTDIDRTAFTSVLKERKEELKEAKDGNNS